MISWIVNISTIYFANEIVKLTYTKYYNSETFDFVELIKFAIPLNVGTLLLLNIFFISLYYFEFDWSKRMKVNNLDWPWKVNKA